MKNLFIIGIMCPAVILYWACRDVNKIFIICMILFVTWFLGNAPQISLNLHNHGYDFKTDDAHPFETYLRKMHEQEKENDDN